VKIERERLWRLENVEAIAEMNEHIDQNGLPLAEFRQF
jgi:antitoxin CcdA